jgi:hypothetical protein
LFAREHWADATNEALRAANLPDRVDHRSLQAQGIDREPRRRIPQAAFEIDRRGEYSIVAERMHAEHQQRVQARQELAAAAAKSVEPPSTGAVIGSIKRQSLEEIRREARQAWLQLREQRQSNPSPAPAAGRNRSRDDDLSR